MQNKFLNIGWHSDMNLYGDKRNYLDIKIVLYYIIKQFAVAFAFSLPKLHLDIFPYKFKFVQTNLWKYLLLGYLHIIVWKYFIVKRISWAINYQYTKKLINRQGWRITDICILEFEFKYWAGSTADVSRGIAQ